MIEQTHINLLTLIGEKAKKVAATNGGEYHSPCPFCGGKDRFIVQPNAKNGGRWMCRQCGKRGDAIAFVMQRDNVNFKRALEILGLQGNSNPFSSTSRIDLSRTPDDVEVHARPHVGALDYDKPSLSSPSWSEGAYAFAANAYRQLWGDAGKSAQDYLQSRGLNLESLKQAALGYNPSYSKQQWGDTVVHLTQGLVFPTVWRKQVLRLKLRPDDGKPAKYIQVAGGTDGLYVPYQAKSITRWSNVVLVESEIDALSIPPGIGVVPVATGGTAACRKIRWIVTLAQCRRVLLAFDNDEAGDEAAAWWEDKLNPDPDDWLGTAGRMKPLAHDVNEMLQQGQDVVKWVTPYLPKR